jgi:hypothetical protein
MIGKNINQIGEEDLQSLIDNSVLESKTIEYKQSIPSNLDSDKKEFLADVSSFANASGGDLIYGIVEEEGTPERLEGLTIENADREIRRLDSIIRDGIEPRIPSIVIRPIDLSNGKIALIIRISKSWISPHRVSFKSYDKFYSRSSNGKYPLDVAELRVAFNLSETIIERIRKFRENRISDIFANETPVPFRENAKIVLHLIPIISFNPAQSYDMSKIASQPEKMMPMCCSGWDHRHNIDGFLCYALDREGRSYSYVQLFRNGIIEAVEGLLLTTVYKGKLVIPGVEYERELIKSLTDYLSLLRTLSVETPIFVFLTLLGVKGHSMAVDRTRVYPYPYETPIDRDVLLLPENIIENYDVKAQDILRPCFDSVWNACGFSRSLNYNENGEWVER